MRPPDLQDFAAFLREFQAETDRGAALVGAAVLDARLHQTLKAFMVEGKTTRALLEGGTAPLGTLSARIKVAYALGLIDAFEMREADLIRKVRNEFAHRVHGTTFSAPAITELCNQLQSDLPGGRQAFEGNTRAIFVNATILTVMRLTYRGEYVAQEARVTKSWP